MGSQTEIKDWFDIIRDPLFVILAHTNHTERIVFTVTGGNDDFKVEYDGLYAIKKCPNSFPNPPNFMAVTKPKVGPIHCAQNLLFIWGDLFSNSCGGSRNIYLHREDGFPAIIEVVGFKKHYHGSTIGRKDDERPALRANYIFAHWFENNKRHRPDGPPVVQIRDYREYWQDGEIYLHREGSIKLYWGEELVNNDHFEHFMSNLRGSVDPRSNMFFQNKKDEMKFMLDYAVKGMNLFYDSLSHKDAMVLK